MTMLTAVLIVKGIVPTSILNPIQTQPIVILEELLIRMSIRILMRTVMQIQKVKLILRVLLTQMVILLRTVK